MLTGVSMFSEPDINVFLGDDALEAAFLVHYRDAHNLEAKGQ